MASKERGGAVDNSAKSVRSGGSAGKRVTAPVYNGVQASAVVEAGAASSVCVGMSVAQQIYGRIDSLNSARSQLADTLMALGLYEPSPAKAEDLAANQHHNVLRIINEELNGALRHTNQLVYEAVNGDDERDAVGEDEDTAKEPTGPIMKTQYGRSVYHDSQTAILRLLSIQSQANRLNASMIGVEGPADRREAEVTDSVHACLCNLVDHIDDTISTLHRVNADLSTNLLGATL